MYTYQNICLIAIHVHPFLNGQVSIIISSSHAHCYATILFQFLLAILSNFQG